MKKFLAGLIIGMMLMGAVFADTQTIEAFYNNIKISINGKAVELKDAAGSPVEPFIYNGTTYLPVRAIAEALGMEVKYNETTNTVELVRKEGETQMDLVNNINENVLPEPTYNTIKEGNLTIQEFKDGAKYVTPLNIKKSLFLDGKDKDAGTSYKVDEESRTVSFYYKDNIVIDRFPLFYVSGTLYLIPYDDYKNNILPKLLEAIKQNQ
jgi:hypothetical protein